MDNEGKIKLLPSDLKAIKAMEHIAMAAPPALQVIHVMVKDGNQVIEATDGHRLCQYNRKTAALDMNKFLCLPVTDEVIERDGTFPETASLVERYNLAKKLIRATIPIHTKELKAAIKNGYNIMKISHRYVYLECYGEEDEEIYCSDHKLEGESFDIDPRFILDLNKVFKLSEVTLVGSDPTHAFQVENLDYMYLIMPKSDK